MRPPKLKIPQREPTEMAKTHTDRAWEGFTGRDAFAPGKPRCAFRRQRSCRSGGESLCGATRKGPGLSETPLPPDALRLPVTRVDDKKKGWVGGTGGCFQDVAMIKNTRRALHTSTYIGIADNSHSATVKQHYLVIINRDTRNACNNPAPSPITTSFRK